MGKKKDVADKQPKYATRFWVILVPKTMADAVSDGCAHGCVGGTMVSAQHSTPGAATQEGLALVHYRISFYQTDGSAARAQTKFCCSAHNYWQRRFPCMLRRRRRRHHQETCPIGGSDRISQSADDQVLEATSDVA
jgi:hypothetical protein